MLVVEAKENTVSATMGFPARHVRFVKERRRLGPLAQRLEQGTHNPWPSASNPPGPTKLAVPLYRNFMESETGRKCTKP